MSASLEPWFGERNKSHGTDQRAAINRTYANHRPDSLPALALAVVRDQRALLLPRASSPRAPHVKHENPGGGCPLQVTHEAASCHKGTSKIAAKRLSSSAVIPRRAAFAGSPLDPAHDGGVHAKAHQRGEMPLRPPRTLAQSAYVLPDDLALTLGECSAPAPVLGHRSPSPALSALAGHPGAADADDVDGFDHAW